jgi:hypothetical protein
VRSINPGVIVKIRSHGITVEGPVESAINYGVTEDDWYIQLFNEYEHGAAVYWKQSIDGGELLEIGGERYTTHGLPQT